MIGIGDPVPDARVWLGPSESVAVSELVAADGPVLLLFYLYDWSAT